MKAIKILDTADTSEYVALTNFMGWTIDKEDHVLRIKRMIDGKITTDYIQLSYPYVYPSSNFKFSSLILKLMEEFLADDDESILDISEYVDQEVMSRDDDEEDNPSIFDAFMEQLKKDRALTTEDEEWVCSNCGKAANRCRTKRYSPRGRPIEDEEEKRCDYYDDGKCELASEAPKRWCQYNDDGKCHKQEEEGKPNDYCDHCSDKGNSSCKYMRCELKR